MVMGGEEEVGGWRWHRWEGVKGRRWFATCSKFARPGGSGRANLCHMTQFVSSVRQLATRNLCRVPFVLPRENSGIAPFPSSNIITFTPPIVPVQVQPS